ncbi:MAG TPA: hypothetical protein HPP77_08270 [Candidatus Hydrogenedentes bacterium]|nr:hypothetical protein [Candidatus Hydrogenedentota bacterium]
MGKEAEQTDSSPAKGGGPVCRAVADRVAQMARLFGKGAGHSVRAAKRTASFLGDPRAAATELRKAASTATDILRATTTSLVSADTRVDREPRSQEGEPRSANGISSLPEEPGDSEDTGDADAKVHDYFEAIRVRELEIADLWHKLDAEKARAEVQVLLKGARQEADTRRRLGSDVQNAAPCGEEFAAASIAAASASGSPAEAVEPEESLGYESPDETALEAAASRESAPASAAADEPALETAAVEPAPPAEQAPSKEAGRDSAEHGSEVQRAASDERSSPAAELPGHAAGDAGIGLGAGATTAGFPLISEQVFFAKALHDVQQGDACRREAAMRRLRGIRNPTATRALRFLVKDPREAIRAESLSALAERADEACLPLFKDAVTDASSRVRIAALQGLYKVGRREAVPYLVRALQDADPRVRRRAATCLTWLNAREAVANLLPLLEDADNGVRKAVVNAFGTLRSRLAMPSLIQALSDGDIGVRRAAHEALRSLTGHDVVFDPAGSEEDRVRGQIRWASWWKANRSTYEPSEKKMI